MIINKNRTVVCYNLWQLFETKFWTTNKYHKNSIISWFKLRSGKAGSLTECAHVSVMICYLHAKQDWKTVNNFHVRVRRKNAVTGKFVSVLFTFAQHFCLSHDGLKDCIIRLIGTVLLLLLSLLLLVRDSWYWPCYQHSNRQCLENKPPTYDHYRLIFLQATMPNWQLNSVDYQFTSFPVFAAFWNEMYRLITFLLKYSFRENVDLNLEMMLKVSLKQIWPLYIPL